MKIFWKRSIAHILKRKNKNFVVQKKHSSIFFKSGGESLPTESERKTYE